jgi:Fe-Mn family superoxide dismutase
MSIQLPKLPYDYHALEPVISAATLRTHHGKHHRGYVDKVNALIPDTPVADASLEAVVRWAAAWRANHKTAAAIFNNAAQAWNHTFCWRSLRQRGGHAPQGRLAALIASGFGSHAAFADALKSVATGHFGSGWVWLALDSGALRIVTTANADTPLVHGSAPLLVIDVWEHAYYLDYQERRASYVSGVVDHLLDWDFAARNLGRSGAGRGDGPASARPDVTATAE